MSRLLRVIAAAFALAAGVALAHADTTTDVVPASLYQRLGGEVVVTRIASDTLDTVTADPRLNAPFRKVNIVRLKGRLALFLCAATGGGCQLEGDSMREIHAGLDITEAQLYGMVEALRAAMVHSGIGLRERNELLALLAPFKRDIVAR